MHGANAQATATLEVFQQERDRDLLQIDYLEAAVSTPAGASETDVSMKQSGRERTRSHGRRIDRSSRNFRFRGLARITSLKYKLLPILTWTREFRKQEACFKHSRRGVREREWIRSEEDLELQLLEWLREQKGVTKRIRPTSTSTIYSWREKEGS